AAPQSKPVRFRIQTGPKDSLVSPTINDKVEAVSHAFLTLLKPFEQTNFPKKVCQRPPFASFCEGDNAQPLPSKENNLCLISSSHEQKQSTPPCTNFNQPATFHSNTSTVLFGHTVVAYRGCG